MEVKDGELGQLDNRFEREEVREILGSINARGRIKEIQYENQEHGAKVNIEVDCDSLWRINRNTMLQMVQPENSNVYIEYQGDMAMYRVVLKNPYERQNDTNWKRQVEQDEQMTDMAIAESDKTDDLEFDEM